MVVMESKSKKTSLFTISPNYVKAFEGMSELQLEAYKLMYEFTITRTQTQRNKLNEDINFYGCLLEYVKKLLHDKKCSER